MVGFSTSRMAKYGSMYRCVIYFTLDAGSMPEKVAFIDTRLGRSYPAQDSEIIWALGSVRMKGE